MVALGECVRYSSSFKEATPGALSRVSLGFKFLNFSADILVYWRAIEKRDRAVCEVLRGCASWSVD